MRCRLCFHIQETFESKFTFVQVDSLCIKTTIEFYQILKHDVQLGYTIHQFYMTRIKTIVIKLNIFDYQSRDAVSHLIDRISMDLKCNRLDLILKHDRILHESGCIIDYGIKSIDVDIANIYQEIRVHDCQRRNSRVQSPSHSPNNDMSNVLFDHIPDQHPANKLVTHAN